MANKKRKYFYSNCLFAAIWYRITHKDTKLIFIDKEYYNTLYNSMSDNKKKYYKNRLFHIYVGINGNEYSDNGLCDFMPKNPRKTMKMKIPFLFKGYYQFSFYSLFSADIIADYAIALKKLNYSKNEILNKIFKYEKKFGYKDGSVIKKFIIGNYTEEDEVFFGPTYNKLNNVGLTNLS